MLNQQFLLKITEKNIGSSCLLHTKMHKIGKLKNTAYVQTEAFFKRQEHKFPTSGGPFCER